MAPERFIQKELEVKSDLGMVFPGQGSQNEGMGKDLYEGSAAARKVFEEANDILHTNLSKLMFEGPEDELRQTFNAQPAILTHSVATMRALEEENSSFPLVKYVAGHSVGEYAALVAAGAIDFSDALGLVRERGKLMQEAGKLQEGSMAAILGLDISYLEQLCQQTGAVIANDNCPGQIVVSGSRASLIRTMDLSRALGAKKVIPLPVSGAFHSPLMLPAVEGMKEYMQGVQFKDPNPPIISNISAKPMLKASEFLKELPAQLVSRVRWSASVECMVKGGVKVFLEVGPGQVLTGLVKRTVGDKAKAIGLGNLNAIRNRSFAS